MAKRHMTLQDKVAVADLHRANKLLAAEDGDVTYHFDFSTDVEELCVISGELHGLLTMCCQRCLKNFKREVRCKFVVSPVKDDAEAKLLPNGYEPIILQDGKFDTLELLEDELILGLPIVAAHDDNELGCIQSIGIVEQEVNRPFQVLQALQLNKKSQSAED
jgi:uncharacterized protein